MNAGFSSAYDEVYDFLLSAPTLEQVIAFRPSGTTQAQARYSLEANRNGTLTADEQAELDELADVEYFVRMLKARALLELKQP
jgi:hypothetical protein